MRQISKKKLHRTKRHGANVKRGLSQNELRTYFTKKYGCHLSLFEDLEEGFEDIIRYRNGEIDLRSEYIEANDDEGQKEIIADWECTIGDGLDEEQNDW